MERAKNPAREVQIGIVGKYVHLGDTYKSLNEALYHGGIANDCRVELEFYDSETLDLDIEDVLTVDNAQRWIETPVFDIQPSEFAKLALILVLARVLERNRLERWRDWWPPLLLAAAPMALVVLQPDLGTAMTIVPVTLGMLHLAGPVAQRRTCRRAAAAAHAAPA